MTINLYTVLQAFARCSCAIAVIFYCSVSFAKNEEMSTRIAVFNVSMEASNYVSGQGEITGGELSAHLKTGKHVQIKNIAEIIQRTRPHVILLNEFDYSANSHQDIKRFIENYLNVAQQGSQAIDYPFYYSAPVNTGVDSGLDSDNDGIASGIKSDAFGYGLFPGQYGMAILSQYPINTSEIRTFQHFLWKDMPQHLLSEINNEDGSHYYSEQAQEILRLSSKSHWDVPININGQVLHILASHPTPPVFDGFENRNGKRNHDEIRFWHDYISGDEAAAYIYDDVGKYGGLSGQHFIIAGDLNASPLEGDALNYGIISLLNHPRVQEEQIPTSEGAKLHSPNSEFAAQHTAAWRMRSDYVVPSRHLQIVDSGVFWPTINEPLFRLIKDRKSSSDHRLVWVDIKVQKR